jgi:hypothetical protein
MGIFEIFRKVKQKAKSKKRNNPETHQRYCLKAAVLMVTWIK